MARTAVDQYESMITVIFQQKGVQRQEFSQSMAISIPSTVFIDLSKLKARLEEVTINLIDEYKNTGSFPELAIIDPSLDEQPKDITS
ncbi:MAG TPA: hypothetical protein VI815_02745 [Candidatus Nanoarchaeia archaeon]|nr:hypothetical protein [Candidatus Nanoarchaeia archaeon]